MFALLEKSVTELDPHISKYQLVELPVARLPGVLQICQSKPKKYKGRKLRKCMESMPKIAPAKWSVAVVH